MRCGGWLGTCLLAALAASVSAHAGDLQKLVMPGPVIEGHARIESECSKCHRPFQREAEPRLCLACHEAVERDIRSGLGFHGRSPTVRGARCRSCHSEHRGRDFDASGLNPETFDHRLTDFPLAGAHRAVACGRCHPKEETPREASSRCADCHRDQDVHRGRLGERCADCHTSTSWRTSRFDHASTRFPLLGAHRDVACELCHPAERFTRVARECNACHRLDDAHRGRFGPRCENCHTAKGWKAVRFRHDRDTRFPLHGRHASARCESCHRRPLAEEKLESTCVSCHRVDDEHRGRNGTACERCHDEQSWSPSRFDHDRDTRFALRGAHVRVGCRDCHRGSLDRESLDRRCVSCHEPDDVHRGQQGRGCDRCHNQGSWRDDVFFDHDLTAFPLLGIHAVTSCDQCHGGLRFKDAPLECEGCHRSEDVHRRRLGSRCGLCHNPNAWRLWRFDHATQTGFPLRGAHQKLECSDCHRRPTEGAIDLPSRCEACHADEDAHGGAFGRDCERCHDEDSWRGARVKRR